MAPEQIENVDDDQLVDEKAAAKILGNKTGTLQVWRSTKRVNLPYIKVGRSVKYRLGTLREFIKSNTISA